VVEPLTVEYELHGVRISARRKVLLAENTLLVDRELANADMIAAEFSQLFGTSDGVSMFVPLLIEKLLASRPVDSLFDSLKIPPLSETDLRFLTSALAGSEVEWSGEIKVSAEVPPALSTTSPRDDISTEVKQDASAVAESNVESTGEVALPSSMLLGTSTIPDQANNTAEVHHDTSTLLDPDVDWTEQSIVSPEVRPGTSAMDNRGVKSAELKQDASILADEDPPSESSRPWQWSTSRICGDRRGHLDACLCTWRRQ
jgi:hypothetical protein